MLHALGLKQDQEAAYRHLVDAGSADPDGLASVLNITSARAAALLYDIEAIGLASRPASDSGRYVPLPPELALRSLLMDRQAQLRTAELEVRRLAESYRESATSRPDTDMIDVVVGRDAVAARVAQLQASAQHEVRTMVTTPTVAVSRDENAPAEKTAASRGVQYRVVLAESLLDEPGMADALAEAAALGQQVRIAREVPIKLILTDDQLGLVAVARPTGGGVVGALLVRPSEMLDALSALFELSWRAAQPIEPRELAVRELPDVERSVLSLLLAGLTDRSVAAQLGISERSVQRHVRTIMDRVGAGSRLQLGWRAAQRRWF